VLVALTRGATGALAEARAAFDEVVARCLRSGDRRHLYAAYTNRCVLALATHSMDEVIADLLRAQQIAREDGHPSDEGKICYNLAELFFWSGDDAAALPLAERARLLEERFEGRGLPRVPLLLARIHAARDDGPALAAALGALESIAEGWTPMDRVLHAVLRLLGGAGGDWDAILEAARALPPEEHLEVLWHLARAVPARARAAYAEAGPLLAARPLWGRRFDQSQP
jgi:hypothetical protein